jgi:hypothetical protein
MAGPARNCALWGEPTGNSAGQNRSMTDESRSSRGGDDRLCDLVLRGRKGGGEGGVTAQIFTVQAEQILK